jgi:hypothetical protein
MEIADPAPRMYMGVEAFAAAIQEQGSEMECDPQRDRVTRFASGPSDISGT